MQTELSPQPGQLVGGKYRMIRQLGQGAMGAVYEAEHVGTGKRVAIKWLHPHVMENRMAVERLMREAQASARVRHTNVVDVYDVEREGDALFLVMELLNGEPLTNMLERGGEPFHAVLSLIAQAMRGVAEAHRQGIVHRDIKPDNIFLAYQSDRAQPLAKVLDFGISKLDTPPSGGLSLTQTGSALGTPLYMSYEQLAGARDVDARSDIYAFGVIMYEALTGMLPYSAENFAELAAKVITTDPPTPRELRPEIPEALDQIITWAMRKRRDERPANLGVLLDALHPFTLPPDARLSDSLSTRATSLPPPPPSMAASPSQSGSRLQPYQATYDSGMRSGARVPQSSTPPPVSAIPSAAPPSLRLPTQYDDYPRQQQRYDNRPALMAGTMSEYQLPKRSSGGVWLVLGALAAAGAGAFVYLKPGVGADAPVANQAQQPSQAQQQPTWPPPSTVGPDKQPAAAQVQAQTQPAEAPVAPPPAAVEQPAEAKAEAAVEADAGLPVQELVKRPGQLRAPIAQKGAPAVKAHPSWRPSGEDIVYQPPVVYQPPAPVEEPVPEKPKTIEVPGTAPNPFADEPAPAPADKYRAGRPEEDEF
ncbi:MAG TPA: serine/threonine-protein kinase [Polyangiales bacterium]|nr:serine/threonine-protein kinase [Polyangiales bacterium]